MKTGLTIAGSDSGGGAGIQADIKTMTMYGVFATSAITALTAQNTTGVFGIWETPPEVLESQLDCIFRDIPPDAVKIGMLPSEESIRITAERLKRYQAAHVVVDPVMASTSGSVFMKEQAVKALKEQLFPLAEVVTPNLSEAEALTGMRIQGKGDMEKAAGRIYEDWHCAVLLKGGHLRENADDLLYRKGRAFWLPGRRIDNPNTHGTGCTLSSAIASGLALGMELCEAVIQAKRYLTGALEQRLNLGMGNGPLDHMYSMRNGLWKKIGEMGCMQTKIETRERKVKI